MHGYAVHDERRSRTWSPFRAFCRAVFRVRSCLSGWVKLGAECTALQDAREVALSAGCTVREKVFSVPLESGSVSGPAHDLLARNAGYTANGCWP